MSTHQCDGCGEFRDVTHGKCVDCWRVEAIYLRTNMNIVVTVLRLSRRTTREERDIRDVLVEALRPLDRAAYLKARDTAVDADGCGTVRA